MDNLNLFQIGDILHAGGFAESFGILGDDIGTERVKGSDLDEVAVFADEINKACAHFFGGRLGKSEGENGARVCVRLFEDVGNTGGENLGFASARTSENQHGALDGIDSFSLGIV